MGRYRASYGGLNIGGVLGMILFLIFWAMTAIGLPLVVIYVAWHFISKFW